MVKIVESDQNKVSGSGFLIRPDGYLITCHHVIFSLNELNIFYNGTLYEAEWCEDLSDPEVDIAVLKIGIQAGEPVDIINPRDFSTEVFVCGFPYSESDNFPDGFDSLPQYARPCSHLGTLSTYGQKTIPYNNPWNRLPKKDSKFHPLRLPQKLSPGFSGGPVFSEKLGGAIAIIQSNKGANAYAIRWGNIAEILGRLKLTPDKNGKYVLSDSTESSDDKNEPIASIEKLICSIDNKAIFNKYLIENTILDYAMKVFSELPFENQDEDAKKLGLDSTTVKFAMDELRNLSVSCSDHRFAHIYEKLDSDSKSMIQVTLSMCRRYIDFFLHMKWHEIKLCIDEDLLGMKKKPNPHLADLYPYRPLREAKKIKEEDIHDPLHFYRHQQDGLWGGLRFVSAWAGYQVHKMSLDIFVDRDIPYGRWTDVVAYILADYFIGDEEKLALARETENHRLRKILVWYLQGKIPPPPSIEILWIFKGDFEPTDITPRVFRYTNAKPGNKDT